MVTLPFFLIRWASKLLADATAALLFQFVRLRRESSSPFPMIALGRTHIKVKSRYSARDIGLLQL